MKSHQKTYNHIINVRVKKKKKRIIFMLFDISLLGNYAEKYTFP